MAPFVSVVVPTRDRPELLGYALESLTLQTFTDFEVIVCDNHTGKPAKAVFDRWADSRFKYVTPQTPLAMHDNWEFASGFATGEYLTVLIDKTVLRPSALAVMEQTLRTHPSEVVSWWAEGYAPANEPTSYAGGLFTAWSSSPGLPCHFDPRAELERRFRLDVRRGMEGIHYYWGKICFGAYHAGLVRRIKDGVRRLFYPIAPDYTSMVAALAYAKSAVDVGQPLLIQFITRVSNGYNVATHPEFALRFLAEVDPSGRLLQTLLLKGLYSSHHNLIASDYARMQALVANAGVDLRLSKLNLVLRSREDLEQVVWRKDSQRVAQYALLAEGERELPTAERWLVRRARGVRAVQGLINTPTRWLAVAARKLLQRVLPANLKRALRAVVRGDPGVSGYYPSIIAAAEVADQHYLNQEASRLQGGVGPKHAS